jgi:hypothetical protein
VLLAFLFMSQDFGSFKNLSTINMGERKKREVKKYEVMLKEAEIKGEEEKDDIYGGT